MGKKNLIILELLLQSGAQTDSIIKSSCLAIIRINSAWSLDIDLNKETFLPKLHEHL